MKLITFVVWQHPFLDGPTQGHAHHDMTRYFIHAHQGRRFFFLGALVVGVGAYTHHTHHALKDELKEFKSDLELLRKDLSKNEAKK